MIKFYSSKDPYGYLNNYKKAPMFVYGRWWKNVESAYQAQKTLNSDEYNKIWLAKHPKEARDLGQLVTVRSDWEQIKIQTMYECVLNKFIQNRDIREKLFSTGEEEIAEGPTQDLYWGIDINGNGQNNLGKIIVKVRSILRTSNYYDLFTIL